MKRFLKNKPPRLSATEEKITEALIGTGEHMCTCAALVADIIIEQGQENALLTEMLEKARSGDNLSHQTPQNLP